MITKMEIGDKFYCPSVTKRVFIIMTSMQSCQANPDGPQR